MFPFFSCLISLFILSLVLSISSSFFTSTVPISISPLFMLLRYHLTYSISFFSRTILLSLSNSLNLPSLSQCSSLSLDFPSISSFTNLLFLSYSPSLILSLFLKLSLSPSLSFTYLFLSPSLSLSQSSFFSATNSLNLPSFRPQTLSIFLLFGLYLSQSCLSPNFLLSHSLKSLSQRLDLFFVLLSVSAVD